MAATTDKHGRTERERDLLPVVNGSTERIVHHPQTMPSRQFSETVAKNAVTGVGDPS
jgi:hypothetical protein